MLMARGANDAWLKIMMQLRNAEECSPRGMLIKEIRNFSLCIENPKKRIITNPVRKMSLPYAFGEFLWYMSGRNDLATMQYYSRRMSNFSDDGETLNSAYGYRIFGHHHQIQFDQWDDVVDKLSADSQSRQAIIHLHTPNNMPTKDEVCTLTLQFMIRNGRLDMTTNMRSNDIVWGFTYDIFSFTAIQELLANELRVPVGVYYHNVASMHIYHKDFGMLEQVNDLWNVFQHFARYDQEFGLEELTRNSGLLQVLFDEEARWRAIGLGASAENVVQAITFNNSCDVIVRALRLYSESKAGYDVLSDLNFGNMYDVMMYNHMVKKPFCDSITTIVDGCEAAGKTTFCKSKLFDDRTYIHLGPPDKYFTPQVYMNIILSGGDKIIDRFFFSEIVYSKVFSRPPVLSEEDIRHLDNSLKESGVKVVFFVFGDINTCKSRLSDEDKHFSVYELNDINAGFIDEAAKRNNKKALFKPYASVICVEEHEKDARI